MTRQFLSSDCLPIRTRRDLGEEGDVIPPSLWREKRWSPRPTRILYARSSVEPWLPSPLHLALREGGCRRPQGFPREQAWCVRARRVPPFPSSARLTGNRDSTSRENPISRVLAMTPRRAPGPPRDVACVRPRRRPSARTNARSRASRPTVRPASDPRVARRTPLSRRRRAPYPTRRWGCFFQPSASPPPRRRPSPSIVLIADASLLSSLRSHRGAGALAASRCSRRTWRMT